MGGTQGLGAFLPLQVQITLIEALEGVMVSRGGDNSQEKPIFKLCTFKFCPSMLVRRLNIENKITE